MMVVVLGFMLVEVLLVSGSAGTLLRSIDRVLSRVLRAHGRERHEPLDRAAAALRTFRGRGALEHEQLEALVTLGTVVFEDRHVTFDEGCDASGAFARASTRRNQKLEDGIVLEEASPIQSGSTVLIDGIHVRAELEK